MRIMHHTAGSSDEGFIDHMAILIDVNTMATRKSLLVPVYECPGCIQFLECGVECAMYWSYLCRMDHGSTGESHVLETTGVVFQSISRREVWVNRPDRWLQASSGGGHHKVHPQRVPSRIVGCLPISPPRSASPIINCHTLL